MDTEAFLLEREELRRRLSERRTALEVLHAEGLNSRLLGIGISDWADLVSVALPVRGAWRWIPKGLLAFGAPVAASLLRQRWMKSGVWSRAVRLLRLLRLAF